MLRIARVAVVAACLTTSSAAFAQSERWMWQGLYGGLAGGYGGGTSTVTYPSGGTLGVTHSGFLGGGQVGYGFRSGNLVFGPEIAGAKLRSNSSMPCNNPAFQCQATEDWMLHANVRLGIARGSSLVYVFAGYTQAPLTYRATLNGGGFTYSGTATHGGTNLGLGWDYMWSSNWSTGLEWRHVNLNAGSHPTSVNGGPVVTNRTLDASDNQLSVRLNYHLGAN